MDPVTFAAFEDELEKIAVNLSSASPRVRHALARLQGWKEGGTMGIHRIRTVPKRIQKKTKTREPVRTGVGAVKSTEEAAASMKPTMRATLLDKARNVEKNVGKDLGFTRGELAGKKYKLVEPKPAKARNIPG